VASLVQQRIQFLATKLSGSQQAVDVTRLALRGRDHRYFPPPRRRPGARHYAMSDSILNFIPDSRCADLDAMSRCWRLNLSPTHPSLCAHQATSAQQIRGSRPSRRGSHSSVAALQNSGRHQPRPRPTHDANRQAFRPANATLTLAAPPLVP